MIEMRQFLFLTVFLLFSSIPNLQAKVSSEDIENWFDDNYWVKRFEIFDDALCDIMSSKKDTKIDSCKKDKELSQIKYDADFLRKYECDKYIKNEFKTNTFIKITNDIKTDCKRIFNTYKLDSDFDDEYFSPEYITFALGKKLPFYEGGYKNGVKHGNGIEYYKTGAIYSGKFINGERNGKGILIWPNGARYEGEFKDAFIDGKGTYFFNSGNRYEGQFKKNSKEGKGTFFYSSGEKYIGYYLKDKWHGEGILFDKNEKIIKQGLWEDSKLVKSQKIDLNQIGKTTKSSSFAKNNDHESCLDASDYQGCMNFRLGINNYSTIKKRENIDCINFVCSPESSMTYGTDNLGLKLIPGYYFNDIPDRRAANFWSKPMKLNVNGNFGRYIHIQRIIRYYSEGYSGSLTTIPGVGAGATPRINYNPGRAAGIRQIVQNHIFDCEAKTAAIFEGKRLMRTKTNTGRKKKWFNFEEVSSYTARKGIEGCKKSKDYILSLNISPFDEFQKKELKSTPKNKNPKINCNSPVFRNKPICN